SFERHFIPVNIKEKEKGYSLEVVAPGFTKEDFRISLEKDLLTISAEKKSETDNNSEKLILKEYSFKSFKRSFTVSDDIDIENIEAKYENGVLLINLPRKEQVKETTKQISIQ
ncbi:MAG: Hsp20/alpha crystallin family protein, partial [Flavisolibacter sp.]